MFWANPLVLGIGTMLLSVPIILHFMMQPKPKVFAFPALKFVREREVTNRSRMRLRHLLLLLLRCLLILLMAAALAGPSVASRQFGQWLMVGGIGLTSLIVAIALAAAYFAARNRNWFLITVLTVLLAGQLIYGGYSAIRLMTDPSPQMLGDSQAPVAAVILIDTSPRMDYQVGGQRNLDRAREMGSWLASQLPSSSDLSVLATDGDQPFFSVDIAAAKERIKTLETDYQSSFIPDALNRALELLKDSEQERKELYLITDLTRRGWTGGETGAVLDQLKEHEDIAAFVIDVGADDPKNFSLGELQLADQTITSSSPVEITSQISRLGEAAQRNVVMKIEKPDEQGARPMLLDGKVLVPDKYWEVSQTVDIRADTQTPLRFQYPGPLPQGVHHGSIEIVGEDSLVHDDKRFFTIHVRPAWDVLVAHPDNVNPANLVDLLAPFREQEEGTAIYNCQVIKQSELSQYNLDDFQAVFLLDPKPLSEGSWQDLERYVEQGGGLAIFLGYNAAISGGVDPSFTTPSARKLLTGNVVRQWRRKTDNPLYLSMDNFSNPMLEPFRNREEAVPWNKHPILNHWEIKPDGLSAELPTETIVRYSTGLPAVISRSIGKGRVVVMTTPITDPPRPAGRKLPWNYLFTGYCWPAWKLVGEISQYVSQSSGENLNVDIGTTASLRNDVRRLPDSYRVFTPRTEQSPTKVVSIDNTVKYRFTNTPGQYRLKGQRANTVLRGFSVNLDPVETDLTRMEAEEIDEVLGFERYQLAREQNEIQRQQGTARVGQEFYPMLLIMLAITLVVEQLMSNRFYSK
ncbi:MAG: BatA domain-containing protein [Mariniblastus sp.]|nr:BatA domain-containing protein [Mariniblastus sp.]